MKPPMAPMLLLIGKQDPPRSPPAKPSSAPLGQGMC